MREGFRDQIETKNNDPIILDSPNEISKRGDRTNLLFGVMEMQRNRSPEEELNRIRRIMNGFASIAEQYPQNDIQLKFLNDGSGVVVIEGYFGKGNNGALYPLAYMSQRNGFKRSVSTQEIGENIGNIVNSLIFPEKNNTPLGDEKGAFDLLEEYIVEEMGSDANSSIKKNEKDE